MGMSKVKKIQQTDPKCINMGISRIENTDKPIQNQL